MQNNFIGRYHPAHKFSLLLLDLGGLALAFGLASNFRLGISPNFFSLEFIGVCSIVIVCLFLGNGYTSATLASPPRLPLKTLIVVFLSLLPIMLFIYTLGPDQFNYLFGRGILPVAIIISGIAAMLNRVLLNFIFRTGRTIQNILILGNTKSRAELEKLFSKTAPKMELWFMEKLSNETQISEFNAILITPDHKPNKYEQNALVDARLKGIPIFSLSAFFESFLYLVPVNEISSNWFIRAEGFAMLHNQASKKIKRTIDVFAALIIVIVTFPIMIITSLLILICSRGTILFKQQRVGLNGKIFTMVKFRTMKMEAENNGPKWASNNDQRVYPLGKILRKTRIDELPQCWNILKGEMSLIGPRPERPEFTLKLRESIPYYELRHIVKPGITGWAQVSYPYGASEEDALKKLQYDLFYIKNFTLTLDLNIALRTLLVIIGRKGR